MDLPKIPTNFTDSQAIKDFKEDMKASGIDDIEIGFPTPGVYTDYPGGPFIKRMTFSSKVLSPDESAIAKLIQADPSDIKTIAISQLALSNGYYKNPLKQSQQSFLLMLIAAVVGFLFLLAAITFFVLHAPTYITTISGVSGLVSGFISAVFGWLYKHASDQARAYKPQVDKIQNLILANSLCETLDEERKQQIRERLISQFAGLPPQT